MVAAAVLVAAGLRATLDPAPVAQSQTTKRPAAGDAGIAAFAEAFTRAYLTWDAAHPDARRAALARMAPAALLQDDGPSSRRDGQSSVSWTAIARELQHGRRHDVTVAADTTHGLVYLELQIAKATSGRLRLLDYPAIVGGPAIDRSQDFPEATPVDDESLAGTARRAIANYVAGRGDALAADLAPGSVTSLPAQPLTLRSVDAITWTRPGRQVAVLLHAAVADGTELTLRYRLDVVRRAGRWFVRAVEGSQSTHEVAR